MCLVDSEGECPFALCDPKPVLEHVPTELRRCDVPEPAVGLRLVLDRVGVELVQARERLPYQRGEQERPEEEGYSVIAEGTHSQRFATPT